MKKVILCTPEEFLRLKLTLKLLAQPQEKHPGEVSPKDILAAFKRGKEEAQKQ